MKVVVAMDSFKGSVTSLEAGFAVKKGIQQADSDIDVCVKPLADGGEGTAKALTEGLGGSFQTVWVTGPLGRKTEASYGILADGTAVMEMAEAAGITLIKEERNPRKATTFGVGEMILDALQKGCRRFIIGIGGSATNDGGIGMLQALGFSMFDKNGMEVCFGTDGLARIERIQDSHVIEAIKKSCFLIACDVENPLCGENGATCIYGPQKGVREEEKAGIDHAMEHYAAKTADFTGKDLKEKPGAGAAGGLGFAFISFLQAKLMPGIQLVMDAVRLEEEIKTADYVITGEGRIDGQTAMGKAPVGVSLLAKKYNVKVIALAGSLGSGASECNQKGIDALFSIVPGVMTLEDAMVKKTAIANIEHSAEQIFRLLKE